MAQGRKPKLGQTLGHRPDRADPGDGSPKSWPVPDPPEDGWTDGAVRWWSAAMGSAAAAAAWADEDRPKLERLMWMVDRWWRLTIDNPAEAMRMADVLRRAEVELYLSPAERARAGLTAAAAADQPAAPVVSSSRARLRSVDDAVG